MIAPHLRPELTARLKDFWGTRSRTGFGAPTPAHVEAARKLAAVLDQLPKGIRNVAWKPRPRSRHWVWPTAEGIASRAPGERTDRRLRLAQPA